MDCGHLIGAAAGIWLAGIAGLAARDAQLDVFLENHCIDCHDSGLRRGGLDLETLSRDFADPAVAEKWIKVHDMLSQGEMPPKKKPRPDPEETAALLGLLAAPLGRIDRQRAATEGRSTLRRLNRYEYENTVRDLLGAPWLPLREMLPEDGVAHRFSKVGDALDISHIQMARYLHTADFALRQAMAHRQEKPEQAIVRHYAREQPWMVRKMSYSPFNRLAIRATFPLLGTTAQPEVIAEKQPVTVGAADPEARELEAFGVVSGNYQPINTRFDAFEAPRSGRYKLRLNALTFWAGPGPEAAYWQPSRDLAFPGRNDEPMILYAEKSRVQRKLGSFDVTPEPTVNELDVLLIEGETIFPDPARLFRSRPPGFRNPLATPEGTPGVAYRWLEVEGPILEQWPPAGHVLMFGDLPFHPPEDVPEKGLIASADPQADAGRLLRGFLEKSYRRSVQETDIARYLGIFQTAFEAGYHFTDSMIAAYTAVLCSPGFLYLEEPVGKLDGLALASRLSYFLWNSPPDETLRSLGESGYLTDFAILEQQTERLLADSRSERFISAFLDYWLDLRHINANTPDTTLYPDYYLDDLLTESALDETYLFFADLVHRFLSVCAFDLDKIELAV